MKRIFISLLIFIVVILLILASVLICKKTTTHEETTTELKSTEGLTTALSLDDKITENAIWCGTFQLIWNDLKNELAKQDIVFTPQLDIVKNLNKETFKSTDISEESYYKKYGKMTLELKKEIEKAIKEKFNETSNILDDFNWLPRNNDAYFLYTMLKKEFKFANAFEELEKGKFKEKENVEYFGINNKIDNYKNQVVILYYNSSTDFAIKLITDTNDEVVLCKNPTGDTFNEIYGNIKEKSSKYIGTNSLNKGDKLKIPNIKLNEKKEFEELENHYFQFSTGEMYYIEKALQTIQFELDRKGGKIKSEAGMSIVKNIAVLEEEPREYFFDDTFALFLIESGKDVPYFGARIDDITKFQ